jgi:hypothetical protein
MSRIASGGAPDEAIPFRPGGGVTETAGEWRRVRRRGWALICLYWAVLFYEALVLTTTLKSHQLIGLLLSFPAAFLTLWLGMVGIHLVAWLGSSRFWPPSEVPPPPEDDPPASTAYVEPPRPVYPIIARARGQCGWLKLGLRVDRRGRIRSFQVIDQAPGRIFEKAVAIALFATRLPPDPDAEPLREMTTVVIFLTHSRMAPDWAREGMAAPAQPG